MKRAIIILILAGCAIALGVYLYMFVFGAKHADPSKSTDKVYITSNELYALFSSNEDSANKLYLDKAISVTGKINNLELNENRYTIYLGTNDSMGSISCEMDTMQNPVVSKLTVGKEVNVVGFCNGINIDVSLDRCKLENLNLKN